MTDAKVITNLNQLKYESDSWKRIIEFIILENAHAKNRLAEVIKISSGENSFLDLAEFYLNYYIQQETLVSLLRNDIFFFDNLIQEKRTVDRELTKKVSFYQKKLSMEMDKLANEFVRSKKQFDNFLEANS